MPTPPGTVRYVEWQELFPWFLLFRVPGLACEIRKFALSTIALLLTYLGWAISASIWLEQGFNEAFGSYGQLGSQTTWIQFFNPMSFVWLELTGPVRGMWTWQQTMNQFLHALCCSVWMLVVWSYFGGILCRLAALQLAREESSTLGAAARHARRFWVRSMFCPLIPLAGIVLASIPLLIAGAISRTEFGFFVVSWFGLLGLLAGIFITLAVVALLLGWPLMVAALSTERTEGFDVFARSYSYLSQRPLPIVGYLALTSLLGMVSWFLVFAFAALVTYGICVNLSGGTIWIGNMIDSLPNGLQAWMPSDMLRGEEAPLETGVGRAGLWLMSLWLSLIYYIALSFGYSYFWTALTGIYLVARYDVDAAELDEVSIDPPTKDLPSLKQPEEPKKSEGFPVIQPDETPPQGTA